MYDHDWALLATGKAIPHGLYDVTQNVGYIHIGTSHDTHEFSIDSMRYWWQNYGRHHYATSTSILCLCDGGGSNSSRSYLFKHALQTLAKELGIDIRIAHYPPYTSKLDSAKFFLQCDLRGLKATNIPIPKGQGMFETG